MSDLATGSSLHNLDQAKASVTRLLHLRCSAMHSLKMSYLTSSSFSSRADAEGWIVVPGLDILI